MQRNTTSSLWEVVHEMTNARLQACWAIPLNFNSHDSLVLHRQIFRFASSLAEGRWMTLFLCVGRHWNLLWQVGKSQRHNGGTHTCHKQTARRIQHGRRRHHSAAADCRRRNSGKRRSLAVKLTSCLSSIWLLHTFLRRSFCFDFDPNGQSYLHPTNILLTDQ